MNLFRTIIETEDVGSFLALAEHDNNKVKSITAYPITDGVVGGALSYGITDLPQVVQTIEQVLTES